MSKIHILESNNTFGYTVECIETICPGLNPANAAVEYLVDTYILDWKAYMSRVLKYYGHTIEGT